MTANTPEPGDLEERAAEAILGDADLRDALTDEEAAPLIDWGLAQVSRLARDAAASASPEMLDEATHNLRRLMKRINRFVAARAEGDSERLQREMDRMSVLSSQLFGALAVQPDESGQQTFLQNQAEMNNDQVILRLLAMYGPPWDLRAPLTSPPEHGKLAAPPEKQRLAAPPSPERLAAPPQPRHLQPPADSDSQEPDSGKASGQ